MSILIRLSRNRRKNSPGTADGALLPQAPRGILINKSQGGNSGGAGSGSHTPKSKSTTHIPLNRDFDDCVMISDHASVGSAERNPDLIPISKGKWQFFCEFFLGDSPTLVTELESNKFVTDLSASDEDAGFGSHGEKTRYATLQRMQRYTPAPSNYNQQQCDPNTRAGYQTMRPYRHDNSGIPTIVSQTYAPTLTWAFSLSFNIFLETNF